MKNQKGITLVALVVTIIVLLILAGVSLNLVAGSDGILGKASGAVDAHEIATIKEKVEMKVGEEVENFYEDKYVKRTISSNDTALQYLNGFTFTNKATDTLYESNNATGANPVGYQLKDLGKDRRSFTEAGATYTITINFDKTAPTTKPCNFEVVYEKSKTLYNLRSDNGSGANYNYSTNATAPTASEAKKDALEKGSKGVIELTGTISENGSITWWRPSST